MLVIALVVARVLVLKSLRLPLPLSSYLAMFNANYPAKQFQQGVVSGVNLHDVLPAHAAEIVMPLQCRSCEV